MIGGIIAGLVATFIYQRLSSPSLSLSVGCEWWQHIDTMFDVLRVEVTNREHRRFVRWFLRRSAAHSCHAQVQLSTSEDSAILWQAVWLPRYRPASIPAAERGPGLSFGERPRETLDIDGGARPVIRIAAKRVGESVCYIAITGDNGALTLGQELAIGDYPLKIEITCLNSSPVTKKFVLENKGVATDLETLARSFALKGPL